MAVRAAGEANGEEAAVAQPEQAAVGVEAAILAVRAAGGANGEEAAIAQPGQAAVGPEAEAVAARLVLRVKQIRKRQH